MAHITSGHAEILAHGQVTAFGGAPIRLGLEEEMDLALVFSYATEPEHEGVAVRTAHYEGELHFELVNFDAADGRGSARPVLVGEMGEHAYFLHFRSFLFGRTEDHTLHYTVYRVRKDDVGWTLSPG